MQTRLRIGCLLFVASLLWTSPMSAATQRAKEGKAERHLKLKYMGIASWYGRQHQGRKMANGQRFDRTKLTAASWYFPLGAVIRVVNLENGESVIVTITDRGPNLRLHRVLDLSEAAAARLNYVSQGLTEVFLYPVAAFATEPAALDADLAEPSSDSASPTYEATLMTAPTR